MMTGWIAAVIGIIIVVFSLNSLIREIRKKGIPDMEDQSFSDTFYALLNRVEQLERNLDDINQTFYETIERLEKRVEMIEKNGPMKIAPTRMQSSLQQEFSLPSGVEAERLADRVPTSASELPGGAYMAAEIRRLLNEGKDSQQVAKEMNLGVGEVELIRRVKSTQQQMRPGSGKNPKSPF